LVHNIQIGDRGDLLSAQCSKHRGKADRSPDHRGTVGCLARCTLRLRTRQLISLMPLRLRWQRLTEFNLVEILKARILRRPSPDHPKPPRRRRFFTKLPPPPKVGYLLPACLGVEARRTWPSQPRSAGTAVSGGITGSQLHGKKSSAASARSREVWRVNRTLKRTIIPVNQGGHDPNDTKREPKVNGYVSRQVSSGSFRHGAPPFLPFP